MSALLHVPASVRRNGLDQTELELGPLAIEQHIGGRSLGMDAQGFELMQPG